MRGKLIKTYHIAWQSWAIAASHGTTVSAQAIALIGVENGFAIAK